MSFVSQLPNPASFDQDCAKRACAYQDQLTKPPGSLGRLESLSAFYAGVRGAFPVPTPQRAFLAVFAADHGVTADGVSAFPAQLTTPITQNVVDGGAGICVLARQFEVELLVVDVGMTGDLVQSSRSRVPALSAKIRRGTRNLRIEDAMTEEEAAAALRVGVQVAEARARAGIDVAGIGEVGIGNTTAAAALIAAYTGKAPKQVTGRGTGISDSALTAKIQVIEQALERINGRRDPFEIARAIGGLEILAMAGFVLGATSQRIPVVIDGVVAAAAALVAHALRPSVASCCMASHRSVEPGIDAALEHLGQKPLFDLGMRLGEGTGAVIAIGLLRAAVAVSNEMATFESAGLT